MTQITIALTKGRILKETLPLLKKINLEPLEDVLEHAVRHTQHFIVVFVDGHFEIEPSKLAEVAPRVAILSAKYWTDLEYTPKICRYGHLLIELRRLRQTRLLAEVVSTEDARSALTFTRNKFWCMNFHKVFRI